MLIKLLFPTLNPLQILEHLPLEMNLPVNPFPESLPKTVDWNHLSTHLPSVTIPRSSIYMRLN